MSKESNQMDKFNFFLGTWKLDYKIPKSRFSSESAGEGEGSFKKILNDQYVTFDYHTKISNNESSAHAIFVWDKKIENYRYWWYEDSGNFLEATCNFIDENTLCLNWHNSLLIQTFQKKEDGKVILQMKYPLNEKEYELILKVVFTRID